MTDLDKLELQTKIIQLLELEMYLMKQRQKLEKELNNGVE